MSNEINHEVFGSIKYNYGWVKEEEIYCWGQNRIMEIVIDAEEDAEFEHIQEEAFNRFFSNIDSLLAKAEESVFQYYQEVCSDYRDRLGDDLKDKVAPMINSKQDIIKLVSPKQVLFPMAFDEDIREVGILLDCTWEKEHGLAIKFQNEEVVEVGYQDIIL